MRDAGAGAGRWSHRVLEMSGKALGEDLAGKLERLRLNPSEAGHDPFGFDPETAGAALAIAAWLYRRYFRVAVSGLEHVPEGRCMLVGNHAGQLPWDGLMLSCALVLDANPPRFPRSLVERWAQQLPYVSTFLSRSGQVMGSPENARRLLERDETLVVFPEGVRGISKTFDCRYKLRPFSGGFVRLALETHSPVVPVAIIGSEEQYISLADLKPLANLVGLPALPLVPQILVLGLVPLPTKYRIVFGEPMRLEGDADEDEALISRKAESVRAVVQSLVLQGLALRSSVFY